MAQRTGLEPATPGVTGRYSNQLNYRCNRKNGVPCRIRTCGHLIKSQMLYRLS